MARASASETVSRARSGADADAREHGDPKKKRLDLFQFVPFRLNRLAAEVSAALSAEYQARYGLDIPEWRVLATLGFRNDACSAQYISQCTRTHKSTISRAVTSLMHRQLVERVENEDDRREFRLRLTPQGPGAVRRTDPAPVAPGAGDPVLPVRAGAQGFRGVARQDREEPRSGSDQRGGGREAGVLSGTSSPFVIPGCASWRRPGIHTHYRGYRFRARASRAPE